MIKKIYAILFAFSLTAALPTCSMENNVIDHHEVTYPCDYCNEEKSLLDYINIHRDGIDCLHILCSPCKTTIEQTWKKPVEDATYWNCYYCSYFYHEKNKQCWQKTTDDLYYSLGATNQRAKRFKVEYPDRTLLDITSATLSHQSSNNPTDRAPILPTDTLQWLGAASIATIICYVAYQASTCF